VLEIAHRVVAGEIRAVARACRLADDRVPGYQQLLKALYPHTGQAWVIGVTGPPGAGKSTLTDRLISAFRDQQSRVGVVAVDPTSPFSGGAILGDRIRMQRHFEDPEVFIRSLATRGALGGLSRSAADVVRVLDAWKADVVIVETVGVGQDELEVTRTAHTTLVVLAPGLGDDVQAIKAGILEVADVFSVNKADREGVDATVRDLELMLALGANVLASSSKTRGHSASAVHVPRELEPEAGGWVPPIVPCVATRNQGIAELVTRLAEHRHWLESTEAGRARRSARLHEQMIHFLRDALAETALETLGDAIRAAASKVEARELDPYTACEALVDRFRRTRAR
jgi:LAO/AO transport system kinase